MPSTPFHQNEEKKGPTIVIFKGQLVVHQKIIHIIKYDLLESIREENWKKGSVGLPKKKKKKGTLDS